MARIYISSTFEDLREYREAVRETLRRVGHEDIAMEHYGASDDRPLDKCLSDVSSCDIYIGIVAWRYGYIPEGQEYSITELEYRTAKQAGKPCLMFLVDENAPWRPADMEFSAIDKIQAFRRKLRESHTVATFSSVDMLSERVTQALLGLEKKGNKANSEDQLAFKRFEQDYRAQMVERHAYIVPPIYNASRRKFPLNSLYVSSRIVAAKDKDKKAIPLQTFISQIQRTVVLGSPGGGKSTLANKICVAIGSTEKTEDDLNLIPALVVLREYAERKKSLGDTVVDFLRYKATADYQVVPPKDIFEQWLEQGWLTVIFDGLDELVETVDRQDIASAIESFGSRYPKARILITCRKVGYQEAALDPNVFNVYELTDFEPADVKEYVNNWFTLEEVVAHTDTPYEAKAFLSELNDFPKELQTNPLILALLCNIYRGEGYIPRNRLEIYRKCSELLLERRDRERHIRYDLPFEGLVHPTVMHLAWWICGNRERENGVTEDKLIAQTAEYLQMRHFEDSGASLRTARQFVEFCRGRAWIFTDTGTTKEGERIYQFTHRTFLEYYAALHLVRTQHTPEALYEYLEDHVRKHELTTVCLIAFQQLAKEIDGAADTLIERLLSSARTTGGQERTHFLMFATETLESFIPKPHLVREVTNTCLNLFLGDCVQSIQDEQVDLSELYFEPIFSDPAGLDYDVFPKLARAAAENRPTIADSLEEQLVATVTGSDELKALVAAELSLMLSPSWSRFERSRDALTFLSSITERILKKCSTYIIENLAPKSMLIAVEMFEAGFVSLEQLVKLHDAPVFFEELHYTTIRSVYRGELAPTWLSHLCTERNSVEDPQRLLQNIQEIGRLLLSKPTPWMTPYPRTDCWSTNACQKGLSNYDSNTLFGVFIILTFLYERWYDVFHDHFPAPEKFTTLFPDYLYWVFIAHFSDQEVEDDVLAMETKKCGFSREQSEFVLNWSRNHIHLLG